MYIFGSRGLAILTNWSRSKWAPRCRFIIIYLRRALNHAYQAEFAWRRHQPHGRNREESRRRERKVVSPPRIINRLANLTSVLHFRIAHAHDTIARDTRAPWFMRKSTRTPFSPPFHQRARYTRYYRCFAIVPIWYSLSRSVNTFSQPGEYIYNSIRSK